MLDSNRTLGYRGGSGFGKTGTAQFATDQADQIPVFRYEDTFSRFGVSEHGGREKRQSSSTVGVFGGGDRPASHRWWPNQG